MVNTKWSLQAYEKGDQHKLWLHVRYLAVWHTIRKYSSDELDKGHQVHSVLRDGRWYSIHYLDGTEEKVRPNALGYYLSLLGAGLILGMTGLACLVIPLILVHELGAVNIIAGAVGLVVVGGAILFLCLWMFAFTDTMEKLDDPDPSVRDQAERSAILSMLSDSKWRDGGN